MILITGDTGFIGSHLKKELVKEFPDVFGCSRAKTNFFINSHLEVDLTNLALTKSMLAFMRPDVVIHCAANPNIRVEHKDIPQLINDNFCATQNLLMSCQPGTHFIFLSSIVVYGDCKGLPFDEEDKCIPSSIYGISKLSSEYLCNYFTEHFGVNCINLRICATVGSGLTHGMLYDFNKKVKTDTYEFPVFGNEPGSKKPFLHIEDLVGVVKKVIKDGHTGTYNVCPNDNASVKEIAELFLKKHNSNKKLKWLGETWAGDNPVILANNSGLTYALGYDLKYRTSLSAIEAHIEESINVA